MIHLESNKKNRFIWETWKEEIAEVKFGLFMAFSSRVWLKLGQKVLSANQRLEFRQT
jgi:hypothetical protein